MSKDPHSINLFKKEEKSVLEKFLDWALTIGRILVILTEGVALAAFLYRFTLDRQLIDLHDEIKKREAVVKQLEPNEKTYRDLQARLAQVKELDGQAVETKKLIDDMVTFGKGNAIFNTLTVTPEAIRIDADVKSISALSQLIQGMKNYKEIKSISIDKIENKTTEAVISVELTLKLANAPVTTPPPVAPAAAGAESEVATP